MSKQKINSAVDSNRSLLIVLAGLLLSTLFTACDASNQIEMSGNEAAAIKSLQTLSINQRLYYKQQKGNAYGTFNQMIADVELDKRFAGDTPVVAGYVYTMKITPKNGSQPPFFSINAEPAVSGFMSASGAKHYYVDANSDLVRVNNKQPAGPEDPPVVP